MQSERADRFGFVVQTAALLFACSAFAGYVVAMREEYRAYPALAVFLGPPAAGAVLFIGAVLGFPDLLGGSRIAFPMNFTLPVVFALLTRVALVVWASQSSAAFRPFDPIVPALVWEQTTPLVAAALVQCGVLSGIAALAKRRA